MRWLDDTTRSHAFNIGRMSSLCGLSTLPTDLEHAAEGNLPRCKTCQRMVVQKLAAEQQAAAPTADRWREQATRAVMGSGWAYVDTAAMPSWREAVDRVAGQLADAFREGILQGSATTRSGTP